MRKLKYSWALFCKKKCLLKWHLEVKVHFRPFWVKMSRTKEWNLPYWGSRSPDFGNKALHPLTSSQMNVFENLVLVREAWAKQPIFSPIKTYSDKRTYTANLDRHDMFSRYCIINNIQHDSPANSSHHLSWKKNNYYLCTSENNALKMNWSICN